ncbi:flagellar basal body rod modification protein [Aminobacter sp. DSM 101952]|uniref:flagellar hook assembly protein FlgD n=1 Tax=Aminobacter sp. DSM 101952 TaxID=2735891 RepID=UPI0006FCB24C|nr:flagellar hook assembly protein FlgD [Aminobacter sp. DSM 101952]KQU64788.1 flagellar basal body rod modification protein [Aminobacter sp. DSM 101952]
MAIDYTTSVPGTSSANKTATGTPAPSKTQVDYNSFLKLLVAQMKNQDPTKPMDSTQYVAQLATFSQVEQSVQMNTRLDQILQGSALAQADALIGRTVTSPDGKTSGVVAEVRLFKDGVVAVLTDGKQVVINPGVSIKATPA